MVDLDSNPTKLIDAVETGKAASYDPRRAHHFLHSERRSQILRDPSRDIAGLYAVPGGQGPLSVLNVMKLATPGSAILSAVIFNALIIIALVPLALKGSGTNRRVPRPCSREYSDLRIGRHSRPVCRNQAHRYAYSLFGNSVTMSCKGKQMDGFI